MTTVAPSPRAVKRLPSEGRWRLEPNAGHRQALGVPSVLVFNLLWSTGNSVARMPRTFKIILDSCHSTAEVDHKLCPAYCLSQADPVPRSPYCSPCLVAVTLQSNTSSYAIQHRVVHAMERSMSALELSAPPGQSLRTPSPIDQQGRSAKRRVSSAGLDNRNPLQQFPKTGLRDAVRHATTHPRDPSRDEVATLEAHDDQTSMEGQQSHRKLAYQHHTFCLRHEPNSADSPFTNPRWETHQTGKASPALNTACRERRSYCLPYSSIFILYQQKQNIPRTPSSSKDTQSR